MVSRPSCGRCRAGRRSPRWRAQRRGARGSRPPAWSGPRSPLGPVRIGAPSDRSSAAAASACACRLQPLEVGKRRLRLGDSDLGCALGQGSRHLQAGPGHLHRQPRPCEPLQGLVQAGARVPLARWPRTPCPWPALPPPSGRDRAAPRPGDPGAGLIRWASSTLPRLRGGRRPAARAAGRPSSTRRRSGTSSSELCGGPFEQVPGQRHLAAGQPEGGERGDDVRMLLQSIQQLSGLLQATLPDAQVGQADQRGRASPRHPMVEVAGGRDQLGLRLPPAPGRGQDAAVVGAAEGGRRRCSAACARRPRASTGRPGPRR